MVIIEKVEILKIKIGRNWVVEVTDNKPQGTKEFWLYHEQYGVKDMMFGIKAEETGLIDDFITNIIDYSKEYRKMYIDRYIDDIEI